MSKSLILNDPWPRITAACKRGRADVAVAYVGRGATRLLPLRRGSRLVADASELAVRTGQTDPRELLKYFRRGVEVFSQPNLHSKIFAFPKVAFVGSNNASNRSAYLLFEAAVALNSAAAIAQAHRFVSDVAKSPVGEEFLKKRVKIYRPPRLPGGDRRPQRAPSTPQAAIAAATSLRVVQLEIKTWGEEEYAADASGRKAARKKKTRGFDLDSFGHSPGWRHHPDEEVLQVLEEDGGRVMLSPPGRVLVVRKVRSKRMSMVVLELPPRNRKRLSTLRGRLPRETLKQLRRSGLLSPPHAALVRELWNVKRMRP